MPGDLEDFLKRAAQRREQNANRPRQPPQQAQRPAGRPEYTDSRRERQVAPVDDEEEVFVAELAPVRPMPPMPAKPAPVAVQPPSEQPKKESVFTPTADVFQAREASVFDHKVGALDNSPQFAGIQSAEKTLEPASHPILELLRSPQTIAQAVLMREILDRPIDRWK